MVIRKSGPATWLALIAWAQLPGSLVYAQQQSHWSDVDRVVAFGDVHGAYAQLLPLLTLTGVIDSAQNWSGGQTHLISVGDLLDRGPDSRQVMDLLMRLQQQAADEGGRVHVVLGNHELMNLIGDLRYVSPGEYAAFAADESVDVREAAFADFRLRQPDTQDLTVLTAQFDQRYPRGYFAHRQAFAADGEYGAWLLSLPTLVAVNDVAFVHGGLPEMLAQTTLDQINDTIRDDLKRYLTLRSELANAGILPAHDMQNDLNIVHSSLQNANDENSGIDPAVIATMEAFVAVNDATEININGPHWYRGSVYCQPILEAPILEAALTKLGVEHVVVGHTPTETRRVHTLYDGKLIMLDTGMQVDYYSGRPAALIAENDRFVVQYTGPEQRETIEPGGAYQAYGLSHSQLLVALQQGSVESIETTETEGPAAVQLRYRDKQLSAQFYAEDRQHTARLELAAYTLDQLLGLDLVPLTVQREIGAQAGALQLRFPDAITEAERAEQSVGSGAWCAINPQAQLMYAFDLLISNRGRSAQTLMYRQSLSNLSLIDHAQSFGTDRSLPAGLSDGSLTLAPALENALAGLTEESLEAALGEWLSSRQLRGLLARRDELTERF